MDVTLSVQADPLTPEGLQELTRDLCRTLNRETDVRATLVEAPARLGAKSGAEFVGPIAIALLTEVTAKIVVEVLFSYFERHRGLRWAELRDRDQGKELVLSRESMQPDQLQQTIDRVREFTGSR